MQQRERMVALSVLGMLLACLLWLVLTFDWTQQGGQFRQIGEEAFGRRNNAASSYEFVANARTREYWPNREPYISRVPRADRVFIRDRQTLSQFKGYTPGSR